jgi:hypothetical protein
VLVELFRGKGVTEGEGVKVKVKCEKQKKEGQGLEKEDGKAERV